MPNKYFENICLFLSTSQISNNVMALHIFTENEKYHVMQPTMYCMISLNTFELISPCLQSLLVLCLPVSFLWTSYKYILMTRKDNLH